VNAIPEDEFDLTIEEIRKSGSYANYSVIAVTAEALKKPIALYRDTF